MIGPPVLLLPLIPAEGAVALLAIRGVTPVDAQTGESCADRKVAVRFKNLGTGYADGQQHRVVNGVVQNTVDGVIVGFGAVPGVGRVRGPDRRAGLDDREMEQISGTATFTLN
ncbi:hypothetical protein [Nocardia sp. X0981]